MKISALPLEALLFKLKAPGTGFNDQVIAKAPLYELEPWEMEFPDTIYKNSTSTFLLGQVDPEQIGDQGPVGHNRAWMYALTSDNQNLEKPTNFAGLVRVGLDFNLEWTASAAEQNFETHSLLMEDVITEIVQPYNAQNWGPDVVYNGAFSCTRTLVNQTGSGSTLSLRQMVFFRFAFQINS